MPAATMSYVLSHILQNIPIELLNLAFRPQQYCTTIEQRIISEIVEGPILLDTNLVGGMRRDIILRQSWKMDLPRGDEGGFLGTGMDGSFYTIPREAREGRNISSVIGVTQPTVGGITGTGLNTTGGMTLGNTVPGMLSQMMNSRTFSTYPQVPLVTLEGTNIVKFVPDVISDGLCLTVMLEFDAEFLNMNSSAIFAMRNLCLCATQRYIANTLQVPVDETEVVAGMEIGVIKELITRYLDKADQYQELLIKLKGALHADRKVVRRLIYHML